MMSPTQSHVQNLFWSLIVILIVFFALVKMEGASSGPQDQETPSGSADASLCLVPRRRHALPPLTQTPEDVEGSNAVGYSSKSALETEVVLEHLFRFLSPHDLCSARQVCRLWNEEAIPHLKKRSPAVGFHGRAYLRTTTEEQLTKFLACAQSSDHFPFTNLSLTWHSRNIPTWNAFIESTASWVTSFVLDHEVTHVLPPGTTFPQLSALDFRTMGWAPEEKGALLLQVLANAPQLSTLTISDWDGVRKCYLRLLLDQGKKLLQLKHLTLTTYCSSREPAKVDEFCGDVLHFLESQRTSLQTLILTFVGNHKLSTPSFIFPELEKLSLSWNGKENVFQDPLQYAHTFPKLRSLCLFDHTYREFPNLRRWEIVLWRQQKVMASVSHLSVRGLHDPASRHLFRENAPKLFPNITKLKLHDCQGIVWSVKELMGLFGKLDQLSLEVTGEIELWRTLTGETQVRCLQMAGLWDDDLEVEWRELRRFRRKIQCEPCAALRRLRVLKLKYLRGDEYLVGDEEEYDDEYDEETEIVEEYAFPMSETLCQLMMLQMPYLQTLHLLRAVEMEGPRPLTSWMAEMERNTTIIFN